MTDKEILLFWAELCKAVRKGQAICGKDITLWEEADANTLHCYAPISRMAHDNLLYLALHSKAKILLYRDKNQEFAWKLK